MKRVKVPVAQPNNLSLIPLAHMVQSYRLTSDLYMYAAMCACACMLTKCNVLQNNLAAYWINYALFIFKRLSQAPVPSTLSSCADAHFGELLA